MEHKYLCKYFYVGSKKYHGSQRQPDFLTVEECIIASLKKTKYIENSEGSKIEFASRTDKFVSARGAAFSFITNKKLILMEINSALPRNIGLWSFSKVPLDFSSRFNATMRHYRYIYPIPVIFLKGLDVNLVKETCGRLKGHHNFINFCKKESDQGTTLRDLEEASVMIQNQYIIFDFKSKGFLRQQIRRMVKMIMDVGLKKIELEEFMNLFNTSVKISYQPADPTGLILWDIFYDKDISFEIDPKSVERMGRLFFDKMIKHGLKNQLYSILQQNDFS
ncbi:MAG: tRNA pseudouridine(38-40) synthase TruA [Promethearchaeota archaeon]